MHEAPALFFVPVYSGFRATTDCEGRERTHLHDFKFPSGPCHNQFHNIRIVLGEVGQVVTTLRVGGLPI